MQFEVGEVHALLRQTVREFAGKYVAPRAAEIDEKEEYPEDLFQLMREHQFLGLFLPEEYGGTGMGFLGAALAVEEIARFCSNTPLFIVLGMLSTRSIQLSGTEAQKKRYLTGIATGELRGSMAMTEYHAGTDVANIRTRAVREGDEWVINGQKAFCTGPTHADFVTVGAKTDPEAGTRGITYFIVPTDTPGFRVGRHERKMGMHGVPTCEVLLENCRIPAENQVGQLNQAFKTAMIGFNQMRPIIGARGVGLAQGCLDYATNYAKEREAFGQPIGQFQAVQLMLADMFIAVETARLLVYKAASMVDAGMTGKEHVRFFSAAKSYGSDVAMKVSIDAIQVLGGAGYMKDHPLERFMRDAKQIQIVEGTNQIQRLLVARNLLNL